MSGVYFIRCGDSVKIGFATDLPMRLRSLQTGNPNALTVLGYVAGTQKAEKAMHRALADARGSGEWFAAEPAMRLLEDCLASCDVSASIAACQQRAAAKAEASRLSRQSFEAPFAEAVAAAFQAAVDKHGSAFVAKHVGLGQRQLSNVINMRAMPAAHRLFALLALDDRALDEIAALYGLAVVPAIAQIDQVKAA
jgi:hypothetical protein